MRKCPYCEGEIEDNAFICRHCGREASAVEDNSDHEADSVDASTSEAVEESTPDHSPAKITSQDPVPAVGEKKDNTGWIIAGIFTAVILLGSCICIGVMVVPVILGLAVQ